MNTRITFGTRNIEETLLKDTRDNEHKKSTIVRNIEEALLKDTRDNEHRKSTIVMNIKEALLKDTRDNEHIKMHYCKEHRKNIIKTLLHPDEK